MRFLRIADRNALYLHRHLTRLPRQTVAFPAARPNPDCEGRTLDDRDFEFFAQHFLELRAVDGIGESEFDERFEVAGEVADVVAAFLGRQLNGVDAEARGAHTLDGVGELNFPSFVGFDTANFVEDARREDVTSGDGETAGSLFGTGFFD